MGQLYYYLSVPFGWVIHLFYEVFGNYWAALFVLVVIVKLVLMPSTISQQKSGAKQVRLQPKVNRIKAKYSNGGQPTREQQLKINEETQELYRREGYSAMTSGCLPMLIQFPIMMGLYGVVYTPLSQVLRIPTTAIETAAQVLGVDMGQAGRGLSQYEIKVLDAVSAANMPESLAQWKTEILKIKSQFTFFGAELTGTPSWKEMNVLLIIPIAAFLAAILSSIPMFLKQRQQNPEMAKNPTMGCMSFSPAIMSLVFTFMFPAGVGVYWVMSSFLTFVTTIILNHTHSPQKIIATQMVDETVQRRSREKSIMQLAQTNED